MSEIGFDDLLEIYRNTQFDPGSDEAALTISTDGIAETLRRIELDESLFDAAQISLIDENDEIAVGRIVMIAWRAPSPSVGLLVTNFDALFKSVRAVFDEPRAYYVISAGYARGDEPTPDEMIRYHALLAAVAIFRKAASYVDETQRELVFVGTEKLVVNLRFGASDLTPHLAESSARLVRLFDDRLHEDQKLTILANAIEELAGPVRGSDRFRHLIRNLDILCEKLELGYRLFASSFSYSKIRDDVETARVDFVGKIHKTIVDIQGQLLGVPVATIIVASQLKVALRCGVEFWNNLAVVLGAGIFVLLLVLAVVNQWKTLVVIESEINRQRKRLKGDYEDVSDQFVDIFDDLRVRIAWHKRALKGVVGIALAGLLLATCTFLALTGSDTVRCLVFWR